LLRDVLQVLPGERISDGSVYTEIGGFRRHIDLVLGSVVKRGGVQVLEFAGVHSLIGRFDGLSGVGEVLVCGLRVVQEIALSLSRVAEEPRVLGLLEVEAVAYLGEFVH
jgi:hypothetical protein